MPSPRAFTREQLRAVDRYSIEQLGLPGLLLMENAGRGCAELLLQQRLTSSAHVCVCCGKGNNGGDGFVLARHLNAHGVSVQVLIFDRPELQSPDAAANYRVLINADLPVRHLELPRDCLVLRQELQRADWIVDALLGTGTQGPVRGAYADAITEINAAARPVLAVDLPSGLDCDTGSETPHCVRAKITASFVAPKLGFDSGFGRDHCGKVEILSIGTPQRALTFAANCEEFRNSDPP
ncbi:NAD(P)H-hydrate epimerase [Planctomicrobium sp. SH664]|uniref:NAD(P)H-hydrate epimerase n=1 Tax=Planctomicrobium sp. SH664 TaxID=3448125 RepID=UPI003F5B41EC